MFDNGSTPPVKNIVEKFGDKQWKYMRNEVNLNGCDCAEKALNSITGTHFMFLADDDVLLPTTLEIVADVFNNSPDVQVLNVGFAHFQHATDKLGGLPKRQSELEGFLGHLEAFDAEEIGLCCCNGWGIGPKRNFNYLKMAHSSAIFLSKKIIDITRNRQRELFVKPFGDIGYVGTCFNMEKVYYLDLPLAVIGIAPVREMDGAAKGGRRKWDREVQYIEHTGIKGPSFVNMGADGHLKILYRQGLDKKYDCRLRPSFYFRHISQILSDSPWTRKTLTDFGEVVPKLMVSLIEFVSIKGMLLAFFDIIKGLLRGPFSLIKKLIAKEEVSDLEFKDINDYAVWVDKEYVQSNRKYKTDRKLILNENSP